MPINDILILIPSHSLEDFPSEQPDQPAAGLLNAFAVAWHPQLIADAGQLPRWHRADEPPEPQPGQLVFVPEVCDGWLPHDYPERARSAGAVVIDRVAQRGELESLAVAGGQPQPLLRDLVQDFYALGTNWILVELLSRQMRNFGNIDELRLQNRVVPAARAVLANDLPTAEAHLRGAFEVLLEARERFYPVECYLLDVCLVIPEVVGEPLLHLLSGSHPVSLIVSGSDLEKCLASQAELATALKSAVAANRISLIGGEWRDRPLPLLPLESVLWNFRRGRAVFERLVGNSPRVWGRRKFGLSPVMPQLLAKSGYVGTLHVVLDDGIYPDAEYSRMRWQGVDETVIEAFSRIPLAADSAPSFLRFPARMAESMDNDHVAAVAFARWPEITAPWLEDLQRAQKYAPVLGKFVTVEQFFAASGSPGKLCSYPVKDYFTANLIQHAARREADALSRYAGHTLRRRRFDAANWCRAVAALLTGTPAETTEETALEDALEAAGPDREDSADVAAVEDQLLNAEHDWPVQLARLIAGSVTAENPAGWLVLNPYLFARRVTLPMPQLTSPPTVGGPIQAVDWDSERADSRHVTLDVPGCGFAWIPARTSTPAPPAAPARKAPAEPWVLRNERFEVTLNEDTGGIAQVRHPLRRENRFSQALSYRFPRERSFTVEEDGERRTVKSQYAAARCEGHEIVGRMGAITSAVTWGAIVDQRTSEVLGRFRQTVRLYRLRPVVDIDIELSDLKLVDGDPWNNYFCSRFAWDDSAASLTRTHLDGAHLSGGERFESSDAIEIATANERVTLVTHGLPFHRKTGPRMLDTLLCVAGETQRRFRLSIAVDHPYPLEAARDLTGPTYVIPAAAPPRTGAAGWLFHLDARNVQLLRILDVATPPSSGDEEDPPTQGPGFALRLMETEGRRRSAAVRCFRSPISARLRDFQGQTIRELAIEGDAVKLELSPYEIAEVELRFAE